MYVQEMKDKAFMRVWIMVVVETVILVWLSHMWAVKTRESVKQAT